MEGNMVKLYDVATGLVIGEISEAQLTFMIGQLEEESLADTDYYINQATVDMFEQNGADAQLLALLRQALGNRKEMDVRWERR
jgi:hypothetical protein